MREPIQIEGEDFVFSNNYRDRNTTREQFEKAVRSVGKVHGKLHSYDEIRRLADERLKRFGYIMTKDLHSDLGWDNPDKADVDSAKIYSYLLVDLDMDEFRGKRTRRVVFVPGESTGKS
ncbi:MAG: hypothetical protein GDA49_02505 [Rhodospirillales bacterium]|nr:hypothetical protein [Rhodospirillales bacterium]